MIVFYLTGILVAYTLGYLYKVYNEVVLNKYDGLEKIWGIYLYSWIIVIFFVANRWEEIKWAYNYLKSNR